ncbi:MAG: hypothetical protein ABJF11_20240 [Reichenbachiella sp.]|uniref:hypothetical protein n=1 Tax=Reichenbachiella sp. TaxID=2184521 RepID=UPI0032637050
MKREGKISVNHYLNKSTKKNAPVSFTINVKVIVLQQVCNFKSKIYNWFDLDIDNEDYLDRIMNQNYSEIDHVKSQEDELSKSKFKEYTITQFINYEIKLYQQILKTLDIYSNPHFDIKGLSKIELTNRNYNFFSPKYSTMELVIKRLLKQEGLFKLHSLLDWDNGFNLDEITSTLTALSEELESEKISTVLDEYHKYGNHFWNSVGQLPDGTNMTVEDLITQHDQDNSLPLNFYDFINDPHWWNPFKDYVNEHIELIGAIEFKRYIQSTFSRDLQLLSKKGTDVAPLAESLTREYLN